MAGQNNYGYHKKGIIEWQVKIISDIIKRYYRMAGQDNYGYHKKVLQNGRSR